MTRIRMCCASWSDNDHRKTCAYFPAQDRCTITEDHTHHFCTTDCEPIQTMTVVSSQPTHKVGMTVRVTEKEPGSAHRVSWIIEGKIIDVGVEGVTVDTTDSVWYIPTSNHNIQILGPMAAETKVHRAHRGCCDSFGGNQHEMGCIFREPDYVLSTQPGDTNCPECKGTGTWTNPANAVTTACSMGCGG